MRALASPRFPDTVSILASSGALAMARSKRMSVQKRLRERKKAEAASQKWAERSARDEESSGEGGTVATRDDLEGYGLVSGPSDEPSER